MNLLSAAAKVSSLTMLSRITGLLRETLIARSFGASEWTDAFNVAFRLPKDRKSTRLNSSHSQQSRMPSSA